MQKRVASMAERLEGLLAGGMPDRTAVGEDDGDLSLKGPDGLLAKLLAVRASVEDVQSQQDLLAKRFDKEVRTGCLFL